PTWFTYNELSQIYPIPNRVWDKLSATSPVGNYDASAAARSPIAATSPPQYQPSNPGTANSGALGVAQFLNSESQNTATYTTNPLWKVVNGPFRLAQFTTSGFVKLVPNPVYSGPQKPTITAFEELPFTSDTAELNDLASGALTIGYITPQALAQKASLEASGYAFNPWYDFAFQFMRYNFTNPAVGPIFRQLYFRQAFQSLVNQPQYIKDFLSGYGTVTEGPVPTYPPGNPDVSPLLQKGAIYPYDAAHAVALLKAHGWAVRPGGVTTCQSAGSGSGQCGAGIRAGQPLTFSVLYGSGVTSVTNEMVALQSAAGQIAGITLNLSAVPFGQVVATMHGHCTLAHPCSDWQFANTGGGWVYAPDYYPTGGELYSVGAGANTGYYDSATNQANIAATHNASTASAEKTALFAYEDYLAQNLPMVWLPSTPFQLTMYKKGLKGVVPQGIFSEIYPQYYRFTP
ncbi:MAG TPA: ABC transporter substrate-binding protein, partial [Candidatus Saccharimonadales bacterium]|nr:ABC transporter substrate-binding protein [Candidatus Saccharimonadales bacterium]